MNDSIYRLRAISSVPDLAVIGNVILLTGKIRFF